MCSRSLRSGEAWHHVHTRLAEPGKRKASARKGIPGHHPASNPAFARGSKHAKMIEPPEDASTEDSIGSDAPGAARRQQDLVGCSELEGDLAASGTVPDYQHGSGRHARWPEIGVGRQLLDIS